MTLINIEAEQAILGTILINNDYLRRVEDILISEYFYEPAHQGIFQKILDCKKDEITANQVTLKQFFESEASIKAIGGASYLATLLSHASQIVDIRDYATVIQELWRKRELSFAVDELKENLEIEKIDNLLTKLDSSIKKIDDSISTLQVFDGEETIADWATEAAKKEVLKPIPTNLKTLDDMLNGGFHKEGLYVFAAASGCGKTFFAQNIIINALKLEMGVFFASMEMTKRKIMARFISILSRINFFRVLIANIFEWEKERFDFALREWQSYQKKFFIVEKVAMSPKEIELSLKKCLRKSAVELRKGLFCPAFSTFFVVLLHEKDLSF